MTEASHESDMEIPNTGVLTISRFPATPTNVSAEVAELYKVMREDFDKYEDVLPHDERDRFLEIAHNRLQLSEATNKPHSHWTGKRAKEGDWIAWLFVRRMWRREQVERSSIFKRICATWDPVKSLWTDALPLYYPATKQDKHKAAMRMTEVLSKAIHTNKREQVSTQLMADGQDTDRNAAFWASLCRQFTEIDGYEDSWLPGDGRVCRLMQDLKRRFPEAPIPTLAKSNRKHTSTHSADSIPQKRARIKDEPQIGRLGQGEKPQTAEDQTPTAPDITVADETLIDAAPTKFKQEATDRLGARTPLNQPRSVSKDNYTLEQMESFMTQIRTEISTIKADSRARENESKTQLEKLTHAVEQNTAFVTEIFRRLTKDDPNRAKATKE